MNYLLIFLEGLFTILSPCILPMVPVLLSTSFSSNWRPVGVILGFATMFALASIFSFALVSYFNLEYVKYIAAGFLIVYGIVFMVKL